MKNTVIFSVLLSVLLLTACGKKTEETHPEKKDITEIVFAAGILEADNSYQLTAQTEGYLSEVNCKEGDIVKAGTALAVIENPENGFNSESADALFQIANENSQPNAPAVVQAQRNLMTAKAQMELDSAQAFRYKILFEKKSVSMVENENMWLQYVSSRNNYDAALENFKLVQQNARQQLISSKASKQIRESLFGNNTVRVILGGKIYSLQKEVGDYVKKGDVIATIGSPDVFYAKVNVDESSIGKIKTGQACVVELNTEKGKNYQGTVAEILPALDESSQSYIVKIAFKDSLSFAITGTQLQSNITTGTRKGVLIIPRNFLGLDGSVQVKGKDEPVKIEINAYSSEYVEVISGITEKDVLITDKLSGEKKSLDQKQLP